MQLVRFEDLFITRYTEKWSPLEIATFEGALAVFGKKFHVIQRYVSPCHSIIILYTDSNQINEGNNRILLHLEENRTLQRMEGPQSTAIRRLYAGV